jgi:peptidyl-prolyl cis-trans isomerase D
LLIAVIGFALAAFVLGDFLGYGPMGGQRFDIGKIDKTSISYQEFEQRVSEQSENWRQQTGQANLGPREAFQVREQVWNQMLREILLGGEMERLGIEVSAEELFDMIHGPDPHQLIRQSFTNPEDGSFNPQQVVEFLRNFDMLDPSVQNQWVTIERFMKQERAEAKYHNLIRRAYYVPKVIAAGDYNDRNASSDIRFVYKPFNDISDTLVTVSDRELRRFYDENKESFRREASRNIEYASFNVFPTDQDREALRAELLALRDELEAAEDIAPFINSVSDRRFDPTYYGQGELSPEIDPFCSTLRSEPFTALIWKAIPMCWPSWLMHRCAQTPCGPAISLWPIQDQQHPPRQPAVLPRQGKGLTASWQLSEATRPVSAMSPWKHPTILRRNLTGVTWNGSGTAIWYPLSTRP